MSAALPPARSRPEEIAAAERIVAAPFGPEAEVRVLGGRARLDQRGGDRDGHAGGPSPQRRAAAPRS